MLISVRGTNGSGKSTVMRKLLAYRQVRPIYGALGPRLPEANDVDLPDVDSKVFVLGAYGITATGGCDQMPYDCVLRLLDKYAKRGHVVFEGIIITSVYGRVGEAMEKHGQDAVFLFLDTPLETCLERIEQRRGYPRDARLVRNVTAKFKTSQRIRDKVMEDNIMRCYTVSSNKADGFIRKLLRDA